MKITTKLRISIIANIVLIVAFVAVFFLVSTEFSYYRTFTGFLVQRTVKGIDQGKASEVRDVLEKIPRHPPYRELVDAVSALRFTEGNPQAADSGNASEPMDPPRPAEE